MSIEGILLDHFSAPTQTETTGTPQARTFNDVVHSFCLMTENSMLTQLFHTENHH